MAFFASLKQAFGFGDKTADDEIEGIDATVHPLGQYRQIEATEPQADSQPQPASMGNADDITDDQARQAIFESVVKLFNESLPPFLKQSVDPEAQKKYLYDSLDNSLKSYLKRVDDVARLRNRSSWDKERQRLETEIEKLSDKIKSLEEKNDTDKKQQLSAERQKRALAERVHDLESQVANLEAEKEQCDLENKSLINKLRVTAIKGDSPDDQTRASIQAEQDAETDKLHAEISELTARCDAANAEIEQLKLKNGMADTMINDLNSKTSEAKERQQAMTDELTTLKRERDEALGRAERLADNVSATTQKLQQAQAQVDEAREAMSAINEIQEKLSHFEEIKIAKDRRISELGTENNRLTMIIDSLKAEAVSLKKTIETNLYSQAESEAALRKEIDALKQESAARPQAQSLQLEELPEEPVKQPKRKRKAKISAIDDSIDDTDWLVSTPPDKQPSIVSESPAPAFGYQAPVKKQQPENDAQMSLW